MIALGRPFAHAGGRRVVNTAQVVMAIPAVSLGLITMGRLALYRPGLAVGVAAAIVVLTLLATHPLAAATVVVPGVWVIQRVSLGPADISGSDVLLVLASAAAAPHVPWHLRSVRNAAAAVLAFQAVLFVSVLAHPDAVGALEWGHRLFLTGGALVVGAALAASGRSGKALRIVLVVAAAMGAAGAVTSAATGFGPAELLGFHKNFLGSMMLIALLVAFLAPRAVPLSGCELWLVKGLCTAGLLASQSRGAIVALIVGLLAACVRSRDVRRRAVPLLVLVAPLGIFAFLSLRAQSEQQFMTGGSSLTERERFRDQAIDAWRDSPIVGQGMRFFELGDRELVNDPHNVIVASLAETGLVGLVALLALLAAVLAILWKLESPLAIAAAAVLVARFTHGLFDIYWVAGTQTLPWIIVGMALGGQATGRCAAGAPPAATDPAPMPDAHAR